MPSFTFVSTANAFVLRGAMPVFVDIRPDTLNIDETKIEAAITPRTRAIVPVHYAGVGCEMDAIMEIARRHDLLVIEDAAQGLIAGYRDRPLGSIGQLAALSFHETKNIISGEGGALLVNDPRFVERAEIIREKGTNRSQFFRGQVDKYTWVDIGSSYLPGEIIAAFLWAQMEEADAITKRRLDIWDAYHGAFAELERTERATPAADHPRRVRPQRAHVLPAAARSRAADGLHRSTQGRGDQPRLPLRPAAYLAARTIGRARGGRHVEHDRGERTARPPPALAGPRGAPPHGHHRGHRGRGSRLSGQGRTANASISTRGCRAVPITTNVTVWTPDTDHARAATTIRGANLDR